MSSAKSTNGFCCLAVVAMLLVATGARGAVFDFSAQYTGVTASFGGGMVSMSVFDEERLMTKSTNVQSAATFDLMTANGVVVWSSGSQVNYFVYDGALGRWVGESGAFGPTQSDLRTAMGIVTWSTAAGVGMATVHYRVYDRARAAWRSGSVVTASTSNLGAVDGTVAWSTQSGVHSRVYDPIRGAWQARDVSSVSTGDFMNTNGVVAFSGGGQVRFHTYDPVRAGWQASNVASATTFDLRNANSVVAWSANPAVSYAVYDPARGRWMGGSVPNAGFTGDLAISNSTVVWTTASASFARGYDPVGGAWGNNPAARLAYFAVSTNSANAPLLVQFIDMSIGGLAWSWNFGDGFTSTRRSPTRRYTNFGGFVATLTVTGPFGTHATNRAIITDVTPPSGTVLINGGQAFTTNPVVSLTLSATDNSSNVTMMRFSNDGTTWSAWEPYGTNKSWTMTSASGTKTVSAQFADNVTNISAAASDTIQLDTSPLPIVFVPAVNVAEGAGSATVRVMLSTNLNRLVSINYATANGSANAGTDFVNASGRLDFPAGSTEQSFNVLITQDGLVELNETIEIQLSNATNCIVGPVNPITILDDDPASVSFAGTNFNVLEGASNGTVALQLNAASGRNVSVGVLVTNGTASDGDFVATNVFVTIPAGETSASFLVPILNDALDERSETVLLQIVSATNATVTAPATATLTIIDDDPPRIGFSRATYSALESDGFLFVNVWLTKPIASDVGFDYLILGGTATPGGAGDYLPDTGRRTIPAGSTNATLLVNLVDNAASEPDETVHLGLSNLSGAEAGPTVEADVVIYDDDRGPRLLSPRWGTNGVFSATAFGKAGQVVTLHASSNLVDWSPLFMRTNMSGTLELTDPESVARERRFYRTSVP